MDQEIEAALQEMIQRSWQQGRSTGAPLIEPRQETLQLETLSDLRRFIKTMPENTVASIEIRVVQDNG